MQTCLPIIAFDSGTFKERLSQYKYPYYIHQSKYNCETLFEDINTFWKQLNENKKEKKYITPIPDNKPVIYDNLDYNNLYQ